MRIDPVLGSDIVRIAKANTGRSKAEERRVQTLTLLTIATQLDAIIARLDRLEARESERAGAT